MTCIDQILLLASTYGEAVNRPGTTVSWRVFGDGKKLGQLIKGADIQTKRAEEAIRWFSDNWPPLLAWPANIDRPPANPVTLPHLPESTQEGVA